MKANRNANLKCFAEINISNLFLIISFSVRFLLIDLETL